MVKEKEKIQANNLLLKSDLDKLKANYNSLEKEREEEQTKNAQLSKDLAQLNGM